MERVPKGENSQPHENYLFPIDWTKDKIMLSGKNLPQER